MFYSTSQAAQKVKALYFSKAATKRKRRYVRWQKHGNTLDLTPRFAELFDGTDFNGRVLTVHEDKFAQQ